MVSCAIAPDTFKLNVDFNPVNCFLILSINPLDFVSNFALI